VVYPDRCVESAGSAEQGVYMYGCLVCVGGAITLIGSQDEEERQIPHAKTLETDRYEMSRKM
jgi:hypothetical protein